MRYLYYWLLPIISFSILLSSCDPNKNVTPNDTPISQLDQNLIQTIHTASNGVGLSYFKFPEAGDFANIPQDPNNPITEDKVTLGQFLYHETGMASEPQVASNKYTYSCASCHHSKAGFQAGIKQGIGEGGIGFGLNGEGRNGNNNVPPENIDVQPIRTPTALNTAYQKVMLWNGQFGATGENTGTEAVWDVNEPISTNHLGFEGLETQAIAGLKVHRLAVSDELINDMGYKALFDKAFPDIPEEERYTRTTAGLAIAAYERTLFAHKAPFQQWLDGEYTALSEDEKKGALLFFGKGNCASCHTGPALSSVDGVDSFHALGMKDLRGKGVIANAEAFQKPDKGRGSFTQNTDDDFKFKTPQLYNLDMVGFLGHGGSFYSVKEVIEYKNKAVAENPAVSEDKLSPLFQPLNLSEKEIEQLTLFIEKSLYDKELERFVPTSLPSNMAFPNNDPVSRGELGF